MKRTARCPKCQCDCIMHVAHVADAGEWVGHGGGPTTGRSAHQPVPREVLTVRREVRGLLGGSSEHHATHGQTEAYVCVACGYFEEYLREPHRIDWANVIDARRHVPGAGR